MTDDRTGREITHRPSGRELEPAREHGESSVERFYAGDAAHTVGLTEERAAGIVRQSGNARSIAFLASLVIVLFIPLYWLYDSGIPGLGSFWSGSPGRLEAEKDVQRVTDIARGHELYLANCARCHGEQGQGGLGPALNDQAKLYDQVTAEGLPGTGHLNPNYLRSVLEVGGRYVCGDPNSQMPVWLNDNGGPLNYRQIEELVAFLTASKEDEWEWHPEPEVGETAPPAGRATGWRDPNFKPDPNAPSPPPCWRNPKNVPPGGQGGGGGAAASAAPIENPGTAEKPRVIKLQETATVEITDEGGKEVSAIAVKKGEVVRFEVTNTSGAVPHNFYIGPKEKLEANDTAELKGVPEFTTGTQTFEYEVTEETGTLQFACTVPGHYPTMHGQFQVQP